VNAVPIPLGAAAANGQYPIVIFYRAEFDLICFLLHLRKTSNVQPAFATHGTAGIQLRKYS
jgi:hypothetical protein